MLLKVEPRAYFSRQRMIPRRRPVEHVLLRRLLDTTTKPCGVGPLDGGLPDDYPDSTSMENSIVS
jgi:hypothetical protein